MLNNKLLTIVIPSYNTSEFIDNNIKTMLACDSLEKLEIIFINDGSKDNTAQVAENYVKLYPESIRLVNKENGGHGSVINRGIIEATGKYFKVIDGDDYVDTDEFSRFIRCLSELDVDVCLSDYRTISAMTGDTKLNKAIKLADEKVKPKYNTEYDINQVLPYIEATIHGITYKTELLKKNYDIIKFSENIFYEDNEYRLFPMMFADSIYLSNCCVYYYVIDQSNQSVSIKNQQKRIGNLFSVEKRMMDFYMHYVYGKLSAAKEEYAQILIEGVAYAIFEVYMTFHEDRLVRKKELMKFDEELKHFSQSIYMKGNKHRFIYLLRKSRFILFEPLGMLIRKKMKVK